MVSVDRLKSHLGGPVVLASPTPRGHPPHVEVTVASNLPKPLPGGGGSCGGNILFNKMFIIHFYVCLLIPVSVIRGNPPNIFNHVVLVSGDFIYLWLQKKRKDNKFFPPLVLLLSVTGSGIRDPGSEINIPDLQHCLQFGYFLYLFGANKNAFFYLVNYFFLTVIAVVE